MEATVNDRSIPPIENTIGNELVNGSNTSLDSTQTSVAINLLISAGVCATASIFIVACIAGIHRHLHKKSQRLRYYDVYVFSLFYSSSCGVSDAC